MSFIFQISSSTRGESRASRLPNPQNWPSGPRQSKVMFFSKYSCHLGWILQLKKGQWRVVGNRQGLGIYVKNALENDVGNVSPPLRTLLNHVTKAINY